MNSLARIAITGATGRMGQALKSVIAKEPKAQLALALARDDDPIEQINPQDIDVLIDFSMPAAFDNYLDASLEYRLPLVVGTTGLSQLQLARLDQAKQVIPIHYAANMSVGISIINRLLELIAKEKLLDASWQAAIHEVHHQHKVDAPSGTALRMSELLAMPEKTVQHSSVRAADVVGEHTLQLLTAGETIEISHRVRNRECFAKGAVAAALALLRCI